MGAVGRETPREILETRANGDQPSNA